MVNFDEELSTIFGKKYQGCTQSGDRLVEYRLNDGKTASVAELAAVESLPKGIESNVAELKADNANIRAEIDELRAEIEELKK